MSRGARERVHFSEVFQVNHEADARLPATTRGAWDAGELHENGQGRAGGASRVRDAESKKSGGQPMGVRDPIPATPRDIASTTFRAGKTLPDELRAPVHEAEK